MFLWAAASAAIKLAGATARVAGMPATNSVRVRLV
jgi:hypothetical protein